MIEKIQTPNSEKDEPDIVVSLYLNEDKEFEEIILVQNLVGGEFGDDIESDCDYYDSYALKFLKKDMEPNTLYHAYLKFHFSSYFDIDETEYNMDVECLNLIPIKKNYNKWLEVQEKYEEQRKLENKDSNLYENVLISGSNNFGTYASISITYNDLKKMIKIITEKDLHLAHRITGYYTEEILDDKFNKKINEVEKCRCRLKEYLKYNEDFYISYIESGYILRKKDDREKEICITYEQLDSISDEVLLQYSSEEISDMLISTELILEEFSK